MGKLCETILIKSPKAEIICPLAAWQCILVAFLRHAYSNLRTDIIQMDVIKRALRNKILKTFTENITNDKQDV